MRLVFGDDKRIADWASKVSGVPLTNWHYAVGVIDGDGVVIGAASFHDMNGSNVEVCYHGKGPVSPSVIRGLAQFVFVKLGCHRVTAKTPRQNRIVNRHLPRYGFKFEGVMKHYYGPKKRFDAIMYGLLAKDARKLLGGAE